MPKSAQKVQKTIISDLVKRWWVPALTVLAVLVLITFSISKRPSQTEPAVSPPTSSATIIDGENVSLPVPDQRSGNSLESVLKNRRTRRDFLDKEISLKQVSQLLWSAQGVTTDWGGRTTPSAKSTYPLSVFLIANRVSGLAPGEYQYIPGDRTPVHQLKPLIKSDIRSILYNSIKESSLKDAAAVFVITGNMSKMTEAYGGIPHDKEVYLEAGHAAQNLYLQAESLKLGMVVISGFDSSKIRELVIIPDSDTLIYLIPVGVPKP